MKFLFNLFLCPHPTRFVLSILIGFHCEWKMLTHKYAGGAQTKQMFVVRVFGRNTWTYCVHVWIDQMFNCAFLSAGYSLTNRRKAHNRHCMKHKKRKIFFLLKHKSLFPCLINLSTMDLVRLLSAYRSSLSLFISLLFRIGISGNKQSN